MNPHECYVASLGFQNPKIARTRAPANELVAVRFADVDPAVTRKRLGKCKAYALNKFFYQLTRTQCILVDTEKRLVFLGNSVRAVKALAKTVNKPV